MHDHVGVEGGSTPVLRRTLRSGEGDAKHNVTVPENSSADVRRVLLDGANVPSTHCLLYVQRSEARYSIVIECVMGERRTC
jgi:hypothetical protein